MVTVALPLATVLLAIERIAYAAVWRSPDRFLALCERYAPARLRDLAAALRALFGGFKLIQATGSPPGSRCTAIGSARERRCSYRAIRAR